jgi:ribose 5-phosphate isomerase A
VPLELMRFGLEAALRALPETVVRQAPATPDGGALADYFGEVGDPEQLAARFASVPGVVAHGLFPPSMVSLVLVGRGDRAETFSPVS